MSTTPTAVLVLMYWLHMLATIAWLGGLSALALIVLPAARASLEPAAYNDMLGRVQSRLQIIGWLSLLVLGATGMFQMSANPNYGGFLAIDNNWAMAIFTKHIGVLLMVAVSAYSTWGLLPALRRLALLRSLGKSGTLEEAVRLEKRELLLLRINLAISIFVLAMTAWARAAS